MSSALSKPSGVAEEDSRTKDDAIEVICLGGQVTLSGKVRKPATKTVAEQIARAVPGVVVVVNELRV